MDTTETILVAIPATVIPAAATVLSFSMVAVVIVVDSYRGHGGVGGYPLVLLLLLLSSLLNYNCKPIDLQQAHHAGTNLEAVFKY